MLVMGSPQKSFGYERFDQGVAGLGIKIPEPLNLLSGQVHSRKFNVLGPNDWKPVFDIDDLSQHAPSVGTRVDQGCCETVTRS
jgi:hypothetical protein